MLPMTRENITRNLSAAVLGVVFGLIILMAGFLALIIRQTYAVSLN